MAFTTVRPGRWSPGFSRWTAVNRLKPGLLEQCPDYCSNFIKNEYHAAAGGLCFIWWNAQFYRPPHNACHLV